MSQDYNETETTGLEIAVIGMAGRFPGAENIAQFWSDLKNGVEGISFFSEKELEEAGVEPGLIKNQNYVNAKGVLENADHFDAAFFDYSPREAEVMDPQFRLLHECAWEAMENAGYYPAGYDSLIGLYAGTTPNLYWISKNLMQGARTSQFEKL
ncbi:MAG: hypothetical protein GY757_26820, partial [bacterium]|nr:hypothetical protein [bacterium]